MKERAPFSERRRHLAALSEKELYDYFWQLADQVVDPLLEAGRYYTTPAIERSVLLRMGFSSLEAGPIVDGLIARQLLGKGAGHVVWRLSRHLDLPLREAGQALLSGQHWETVASLFGAAS